MSAWTDAELGDDPRWGKPNITSRRRHHVILKSSAGSFNVRRETTTYRWESFGIR